MSMHFLSDTHRRSQPVKRVLMLNEHDSTLLMRISILVKLVRSRRFSCEITKSLKIASLILAFPLNSLKNVNNKVYPFSGLLLFFLYYGTRLALLVEKS